MDGEDNTDYQVDTTSDPGSSDSSGGSGNSWWGGFFSTVKGLGDTAGNIIGGLNKNAKPATTTTKPTTDLSKFVPFAIAGAIVLVVLVLFTGMRR